MPCAQLSPKLARDHKPSVAHPLRPMNTPRGHGLRPRGPVALAAYPGLALTKRPGGDPQQANRDPAALRLDRRDRLLQSVGSRGQQRRGDAGEAAVQLREPWPR